MYNIAICDDEKSYTTKLYNKIKSELPLIELSVYNNSTLLMDALESGIHFDIMILDVEMPKISGMEIAAHIRKTDNECILILLTNYEQYAIPAYEFNIYRYILKSDDLKKLIETIKSALDIIKADDYIFLGTLDRKMLKIYLKDIIGAEIKQHLLHIYISNNKQEQIVVRQSLKKFLITLNSSRFIRIHEGYIINTQHVEYLDLKNRTVTLSNSTSMPISRDKVRLVLEKINMGWDEN
ncbi:MAG: response regulator transcription factor [Firmicutes bacterium]|nr:response regulator transcription factor [Bacillota bacterium]